jgi:hypothetical protein
MQQYRLTHKKQIKDYLLKNRKKILKQQNEYYLKHKEQLIKYSKDYYKNHKEKIKQYKKEYQKNLSKEQRERKIQNYYNKLKINTNFKIICYLRNRIYYAIKNNSKFKSTLELLGCSIKKLKEHLQEQFTNDMSWSNYGKWHIDHIKPCASFDLSKPSEQRKCFNYTNLQPLWAKENLSKGTKND